MCSTTPTYVHNGRNDDIKAGMCPNPKAIILNPSNISAIQSCNLGATAVFAG
jgi:hypothetical protein